MTDVWEVMGENGGWSLCCSDSGAGVGPYVARTRVRVLGIGTYLRVGFASSQNLEYGDTDDKYPKFGYGVRMCLTKIKKFYINLYLPMNHIYGQILTT